MIDSLWGTQMVIRARTKRVLWIGKKQFEMLSAFAGVDCGLSTSTCNEIVLSKAINMFVLIMAAHACKERDTREMRVLGSKLALFGLLFRIYVI